MEPGRFLIFMFAAGAVHSAKTSLEIIPGNGDVQLAEKAYFLCKVRAGGEATLTWTDPEDTDIEDSELYTLRHIDEQSKGLEMTLPDPQAGGIFTCKGDFESGDTATAQIKIRVVQRPKFVTPMEPTKEVVEGTSVAFDCQATGIPPPTIRWTFGNQEISKIGDGGRVSMLANGTLVVKDSQPSDAGVHTCEASIKERNETVVMDVSLNIKFTPRIELLTGDSFATPIGTPAQYNFSILAYPPPSVSIAWKGKVFKGDDIKKVAQDQDRHTYSFEFTPASQEDLSELLITAANDQGSSKKKVTLQGDTQGLGTGILVLIVLIILLVALLVMDVFCYYKRQRGLLMYCRNNILGKNSSGTGTENNGKMLSKSGKSTVVNVSGIEA
uniref:Neural cell adhesion molecule 1-B-like n=1 Tax=Podarcis muralis TaxID=64176 RepID=A0A670IJ46_PODMU|nr:neural cell adhesion molecule 1-B-like [Podarcis muralis]